MKNRRLTAMDRPYPLLKSPTMRRLLTALFLLLAVGTYAHADRATDLAQHILTWLKAGQADSLLAHSSPEVKAQLTPPMIQGLWAQLLLQAGELKKEQPWTAMQMQGNKVRTRVLVFERMALRCNVAINEDMKMSGITFTPASYAEEPADTPPAAEDSTQVTERPFTVRHGKIELPGTLTLPAQRTGPVPAVVLVQGSGPSDRNESVGNNKPFREWAQALAKQGIATLRYDKRTFVYKNKSGEMSGGQLTYRTETSEDAARALEQLAQVPEADPKRLFVLGHSQGGTLLPLIVEESKHKPAGLIGLAALARPFWEAVHEQLVYINGGSDSLVTATERQMRENLPQEYLDFQERYKPLQEITKCGNMPMLFLQGGHDYQVTPADLELWRKALVKNKRAEFRLFPKLDHLFRPLPQMAQPEDYLNTLPLADEAVQAVADFIHSH